MYLLIINIGRYFFKTVKWANFKKISLINKTVNVFYNFILSFQTYILSMFSKYLKVQDPEIGTQFCLLKSDIKWT